MVNQKGSLFLEAARRKLKGKEGNGSSVYTLWIRFWAGKVEWQETGNGLA